MKKNYCIWPELGGTRSAGPRFQIGRRRLRDLGPGRLSGGAGTRFPSTVPSEDSRLFRGNFLSGADRMKDVAEGFAGTRLGK